MKQLVVFGDSFGYDAGEDYCWIRQLATKFKAKIVNLAEPGSAIQHGQIRLLQYLSGGYYNSENDIFVYIITGGRRSQWSEPDIAASLGSYFSGVLPKTHRSYKHYHDNEEFYSQYLELYRPDIEWGIQLGIIALLKTLPNMTFCTAPWSIMASEEPLKYDNISKSVLVDHLYTPNDTSVFVDPGLYQLSMNEMTREDQNWAETHAWSDSRPNHFSEPNHKILAEQVYNCIVEKKDVFNVSDFHKNIFTPTTIR